MTRLKKRLSAKQRKYLAAYSQCGTHVKAAEISEIERKSHYRWMEEELYQAAFLEAEEESIQRMEAEARRRAEQGTDKPVFYRGAKCGVIREYSDTLLIFLLKAKRADVYRERHDVRVSVSEEEIDREIEEAVAKLAASGQRSIAGTVEGEAGSGLRVVSPPAISEATPVSGTDGS